MTAAPRTTSQKVWMVFGIVLAVLFALTGLAIVAAVVLFFAAAASFGSNK
jgi:hypothetical protein